MEAKPGLEDLQSLRRRRRPALSLAITTITVAGRGVGPGGLPLIGGERPAHVSLLLELAFLVTAAKRLSPGVSSISWRLDASGLLWMRIRNGETGCGHGGL